MKKGYYHLDDFLLMKMLGCKKDHNVFSEEERYQAYRMFLKLTGENGEKLSACGYTGNNLIYGITKPENV